MLILWSYPAASGAHRRAVLAAAACVALSGAAATAETLPEGFVYLRDIAPSIGQDMRYAGGNNFTGKPVPGYGAAECVLQRSAAEALSRAQKNAQRRGYSLKVYDCYRPVRAVQAFLGWAAAPEDGSTKAYYPRLSRTQLVPGYIAAQSQHSTGLAVDLTIGRSGGAAAESAPGGGDCTASAPDAGSLDMGADFDCFDPKANTASPAVTPEQHRNRELLVSILERAGFKNYAAEWWHFWYPGRAAQRRDFPIEPRPAP